MEQGGNEDVDDYVPGGLDSDDSGVDSDLINVPEDADSQSLYHQCAAAVHAITAAPNKAEQQPCIEILFGTIQKPITLKLQNMLVSLKAFDPLVKGSCKILLGRVREEGHDAKWKIPVRSIFHHCSCVVLFYDNKE